MIALDGLDGGFEYSDAYLHDNDARFVWGFVRSALDHGCAAANYVESLGSRARGRGLGHPRPRRGRRPRAVDPLAPAASTPAGPYVDAVNARDRRRRRAHRHVLSKGIHLIVDRLTPSRRVLTFFADDGRLFFVIPMGAQDLHRHHRHAGGAARGGRHPGGPPLRPRQHQQAAAPGPARSTEADIIAERCGVRPLAVDAGGGAGARLDAALAQARRSRSTPRRAHVTIFGGKLTDCLNVGEGICAEAQRLGVALACAGAGLVRRAAAGRCGRSSSTRRGSWGSTSGRRRARPSRSRRGSGAATAPRRSRCSRRSGATRARPRCCIEGAEYLRCEIEEAARREMVVTLEDFLRRRTDVAQVVRREELRAPQG